MLKRLLLSHSPAYFFIIPLICFATVYAAFPILSQNATGQPCIFKVTFFSTWATSREAVALFWVVPVALSAMFLPMLSSRFVMFENGMFLNSILWLSMLPACMFFSGDLQIMLVAMLVMPVYYFIFGMYKSEYPVHLLFNASFVASVASLFYLPALIFVLLIWTGWLFYNPFRLRAYIISLTAVVLPFFFVISGYFLAGKISDFNIDLSFLNYSSKSIEREELIFSAILVLITLLGTIRLAAPGAVKKIGLRKNFNYCLFAFAVIMSFMLIFKTPSLLYFAIFPASIIANVTLSSTSRSWVFNLMLILFLGMLLYFPFGKLLFG